MEIFLSSEAAGSDCGSQQPPKDSNSVTCLSYFKVSSKFTLIFEVLSLILKTLLTPSDFSEHLSISVFHFQMVLLGDIFQGSWKDLVT